MNIDVEGLFPSRTYITDDAVYITNGRFDKVTMNSTTELIKYSLTDESTTVIL